MSWNQSVSFIVVVILLDDENTLRVLLYVDLKDHVESFLVRQYLTKGYA